MKDAKFKNAEEKIRQYGIVQEGVKRIFQEALASRDEEELGELCLSVAEQVTQSKFGFIGEIKEKGLQDIAISNPGWIACKMYEKTGHRRPPGNFKIHGIYGRVLIDGKGFFTNKPADHPDSIGTPVGHPSIESFLGVPMFSEGKTIGMISVANREGGYSQTELENLETLAPVIVESLLHKRAQQALLYSNEKNRLLSELSFRLLSATEPRKLVQELCQKVMVFLNCDLFFNFLVDEEKKQLHLNAYGGIPPETAKTFEWLSFDEVVCGCCVQEGKQIVCENIPESEDQRTTLVHSFGVKAHAAIPIFCENKVVGTLSFGTKTKSAFTEEELSMMRTVAVQVSVAIQRKKTEEKLLESARKLHDSERMAAIGQTAGMVGHDIRNPLQAMIGDVYLAKSDLGSIPEGLAKESLRESLESIEKNIEYVNKIIQDLQDFTRPIKPAVEEVEVKTLIQGTLFKKNIPDNIDVYLQVDKKVKKILTDPHLLKRTLNNLISNAVQAMPEGGKLVLNVDQEADGIVIIVEDSGVGIPEEIRHKLFTPLFTTKPRGQGFGLAVIKRITEVLGGSINFESEVGKGTKFILRLPL